MILLKDATVVNADSMKESDVLIDGDRIVRVEKNISEPSAQTLDCYGKLVFPGFIDMHCHLRDPGQTHKETLETGMRSAVAGGYSAVCCMPNTEPAIDCAPLCEYIVNRSRALGGARIFPIGSITRGRAGKELAEFGAMQSAGAVAVSDDGAPVDSGAVMLNALKYARTFDLPVIAHSEDRSISGDGVVNAGENATASGLRGMPRTAESAGIARDVLLAEEAGARLHIAHVSTAESVDIIRSAKRRGARITCETCPHYFAATDDEILSYNTNAKINPPLRTQADADAIIQGIADGTIDVIATDHAPHSRDEKNKEFDYAPFGTVGLETAFSVAYTYLVATEAIKPTDLCRLMSATPARILGIEGGAIKTGARADITVVDPDAEYTVDASSFRSKSRNSLFDGWRLKGRVTNVFIGGTEFPL